jgi:hypothetical protein
MSRFLEVLFWFSLSATSIGCSNGGGHAGSTESDSVGGTESSSDTADISGTDTERKNDTSTVGDDSETERQESETESFSTDNDDTTRRETDCETTDSIPLDDTMENRDSESDDSEVAETESDRVDSEDSELKDSELSDTESNDSELLDTEFKDTDFEDTDLEDTALIDTDDLPTDTMDDLPTDTKETDDFESESIVTETDSDETDSFDSGVHMDSEIDSNTETSGDAGLETDSDTGTSEDTGSEIDSDTESDTEDEPTIIAPENIRYLLNPYGNAPLSAVILISGEEIIPEEVEEIQVTVEGITDDADDFTGVLDPHSETFFSNFDTTDLHDVLETAIPVLGLYPDWANQVSFAVTSGSHQFIGAVTIETDPIADVTNETVSISIADPAHIEPGWTFLEDRVYDNNGDLRWFGPRIFRIAANGNIRDLDGEWNWLGKRVRTFTFPDYLHPHHDVIELSNGNLIHCIDNDQSQIKNHAGDIVTSIEDYAVETDATGAIVNAFDLRAFFDVDRCTFAEKETDWFHLNTLCYDEITDAVLMSGRHQGIVSITRGGIQGEEANLGKSLKWILAPHLDWGMSGWDGQGEIDPNDYLLTAVDENGVPFDDAVQNNLAVPTPDPEAFYWPVGQHGLIITSRDGNKLRLLTFNNQASYIFEGLGSINNGITFTAQGDLTDDRSLESFSQIIEYEIDEVLMTVRKLWSFGEHKPELYGSFTSGVEVLKNTNHRLLITNGVNMLTPQTNPLNPHVVEVTLEGEELYHLEISGSTKPVWEAVVRAAGRIDLYHPGQSL